MSQYPLACRLIAELALYRAATGRTAHTITLGQAEWHEMHYEAQQYLGALHPDAELGHEITTFQGVPVQWSPADSIVQII